MDSVWGTYVPNWIAAVSTALALIAAGVAVHFAWRSIRGENQRELRQNAQGLASWWVNGRLGHDATGKEVWGVVIRNASMSVFHEVQIDAVGNNHKKAGHPIAFRVLPPGEIFVQSNSYDASAPWGLPVLIPNGSALVPLMRADSRKVARIRFRDMAAHDLTWSPTGGLVDGWAGE